MDNEPLRLAMIRFIEARQRCNNVEGDIERAKADLSWALDELEAATDAVMRLMADPS